MLDFNNTRDRDLFMIDVYSDSTMYGGMTETNLGIQNREDGSCCKKSFNSFSGGVDQIHS